MHAANGFDGVCIFGLAGAAFLARRLRMSEKLNVPSALTATWTNGFVALISETVHALRKTDVGWKFTYTSSHDTNGEPSFSLMTNPRIAAENANGLIFTFSIVTSRPSCFESCLTATLRTM